MHHSYSYIFEDTVAHIEYKNAHEGFISLQKDNDNLFQACCYSIENDEVVVYENDCGWDDGICGEHNFFRHETYWREEMEIIFKAFIERLKELNVKVI